MQTKTKNQLNFTTLLVLIKLQIYIRPSFKTTVVRAERYIASDVLAGLGTVQSKARISRVLCNKKRKKEIQINSSTAYNNRCSLSCLCNLIQICPN